MTGGALTGRAREYLDGAENPCLEKPFDANKVRTLARRMLG